MARPGKPTRISNEPKTMNWASRVGTRNLHPSLKLESLADPKHTFVLLSEGQIVGYSRFSDADGHLQHIVVAPEHRAKGVSADFLKASLRAQFERHLSLPGVYLRASSKETGRGSPRHGDMRQKALRKFYENAGAEPVMHSYFTHVFRRPKVIAPAK